MSDQENKYAFGMIGLGTMGRNLLLNMGDHGFAGAGFDKDASKGDLLEKEDKNGNLKGFSTVEPFIASLSTPRAIMMLVPAGKPVDDVIAELLPYLDKGDILIDGGNSHFTDTNRRVEQLEGQGLHFFGMGVSGGADGARRGPSIMPGGDKAAYNVMKPILEAIAAKAEDGAPCVTYIGPGAAGHFVKMVHNGIEYGLMQLIAEAYEIMKKGLQMDNDAIQKVFARYHQGYFPV
jgi:6-phosphogluconate dehydrogenase